MRLYEAMFLVDAARAREKIDPVLDDLRGMVERVGAEVVSCEKWDERRLAYRIKRHRRGTYVLCHFNGPPDSIVKLERACKLSDSVLRVLVVRDEDGIETSKSQVSRGVGR